MCMLTAEEGGVNRKLTQAYVWPLDRDGEAPTRARHVGREERQDEWITFTFCFRCHSHAPTQVTSFWGTDSLYYSGNHLPAEARCDDRRQSVYPSPATKLWLPAGTAARRTHPGARWPSEPTGCWTPSACPHAAGYPGHPTGCAASHGRPLAHVHLDRRWNVDIMV